MTSEYDRKKRIGRNGYKSNSASRESQSNPFVNVNLDEAQEADMRKAIPDHAVLLQLVHEVIENGYAITLKYDDFSSAFACFLRANDEHEFNGGLVLTGRGGSPASALRECIYIHRGILQENWRNARPVSRRDFSNDDF